MVRVLVNNTAAVVMAMISCLTSHHVQRTKFMIVHFLIISCWSVIEFGIPTHSFVPYHSETSQFTMLRRVSPCHDDNDATRDLRRIRISSRNSPITCHRSMALSIYREQEQNSNNMDITINAKDGQALQTLFLTFCDSQGLMTKEAFLSVPSIDDMLSMGDLTTEEFEDLWGNVPKFPEVATLSLERIDVDSFIQLYRDIDDLFEDAEEDNVSLPLVDDTSDDSSDTNDDPIMDQERESSRDEEALESMFETICDHEKLVSRQALRSWSEVQDLIEEGLLGEEEFEELWDRTNKSPGSNDRLDVDGFLSFKVALDDLFVFEDEADEMIQTNGDLFVIDKQILVYSDDLPPDLIYTRIAGGKESVELEEIINRWGDLQEMIQDGDVLPSEIDTIFKQIPKVLGTTQKIDVNGFVAFYQAIDNLFEDEDGRLATEELKSVPLSQTSKKTELLQILSKVEKDDRLPCGLECTEEEMKQIADLVKDLEGEPTNKLLSKKGDITPADVAGNWGLLYTSSSTMKFNQGISGLVPPRGKFGGLSQNLKASKFVADLEYIEKINAGPASFEVRITGDWQLKNSVSLFTGEQKVALKVQPNLVSYGITSQKADHWKSLGPLNLLDIAYLDEEWRIMRGTTSIETIFIFSRIL